MRPQRLHHRSDLVRIAVDALVERGLEPEFPPEVMRQLHAIGGPGVDDDVRIRDLRAELWCSIDNDDSRDLDQLTVCEPLPGNEMRVRVAVADVDVLVGKDSAIDRHAWTNTSSIYTSARNFPMLPERLCTDLSSLNPGQDRLALVTEMRVAADASVVQASIGRAWVHNRAQLAYDAVAAWLDGQGPLPEAAARVAGLDAQLRLQDELAQRLRARRHERGSLELETFQPRAVFEDERVVDIRQQAHNRARQLIEELMIATNECTARHFEATGVASLRRVVRSPERWRRIVDLAAGYGFALPGAPDSKALEAFLAERHRSDPLRFPDLSLVVVKLMGPGEYVVERPGAEPVGHFGLAVQDYTHSTAPNRRFPDLVSQRMLKAQLAGRPPAYSAAELDALARRCTSQEDAIRKAERRVRKSEAALLLESRLGERFDAVVTGSSESDTWVRLLAPPVEGKLVAGGRGLAVGRRLQVKLVAADVERGFIDFVPTGRDPRA